MEYTEEELEFVRKQKNNLSQLMIDSVYEVEYIIRDLIKKRWIRGESVNGGVIKNKNTGLGYSSLKYKNLKLIKNPSAGGNVDLTFTGALGDRIEVIINGDNFEIISTDSKYLEISLKYGEDEFGLNNEEKEFIFDKLLSNFFNKLDKII